MKTFLLKQTKEVTVSPSVKAAHTKMYKTTSATAQDKLTVVSHNYLPLSSANLTTGDNSARSEWAISRSILMRQRLFTVSFSHMDGLELNLGGLEPLYSQCHHWSTHSVTVMVMNGKWYRTFHNNKRIVNRSRICRLITNRRSIPVIKSNIRLPLTVPLGVQQIPAKQSKLLP